MGLTDIHIAGYRSVRSIHFPVRQLSVLVGANGVGKTNLYRALELVRAAATGDLSLLLAREGGLDSAMWAGERKASEPRRMVLRVDLNDILAGDEGGFAPSYEVAIGFGDSRYEAVFPLEPQIKAESLTIRQGRRNVALLERKGAAAWYRDEAGNRRQMEEPLLAGETALAALRGTLPELDAVRHVL